MKKAASGLEENFAAAISYIFFGGIVFLVVEKESNFVRFHAMQSILVFLSVVVLSFAGSVLAGLPFIGWAFGLVLRVLWPVYLALMAFLALKAYRMEEYKLPVIGDVASKQVNR